MSVLPLPSGALPVACEEGPEHPSHEPSGGRPAFGWKSLAPELQDFAQRPRLLGSISRT